MKYPEQTASLSIPGNCLQLSRLRAGSPPPRPDFERHHRRGAGFCMFGWGPPSAKVQKYPPRLSALPEVGVEAWDCGEWHPNAILAILIILAILARFCRNCTGFLGMARCSSGLHANATDLGCCIVLSALPYRAIRQDTFALLLTPRAPPGAGKVSGPWYWEDG